MGDRQGEKLFFFFFNHYYHYWLSFGQKGPTRVREGGRQHTDKQTLANQHADKQSEKSEDSKEGGHGKNKGSNAEGRKKR